MSYRYLLTDRPDRLRAANAAERRHTLLAGVGMVAQSVVPPPGVELTTRVPPRWMARSHMPTSPSLSAGLSDWPWTENPSPRHGR
ncbi:MAG: hypothetical protein ACM3ZA_10620 [Bacillota bacterium]